MSLKLSIVLLVALFTVQSAYGFIPLPTIIPLDKIPIFGGLFTTKAPVTTTRRIIIKTPRPTTQRITTPRPTTQRITTPRPTTQRITTPRLTTQRIPTSTTPIDSSTQADSSNNQYLRCLKACPSTPQYNPVCGTDNVTYDNKGLLKCARQCNQNVLFAYAGTCTAPTTATAAPSPAPTQSTKQILPAGYESCKRQCVVNWSFDSVCGSDGVSYQDKSRFDCHKKCSGFDLSIAKSGNC